jgi:hypothetical protein
VPCKEAGFVAGFFTSYKIGASFGIVSINICPIGTVTPICVCSIGGSSINGSVTIGSVSIVIGIIPVHIGLQAHPVRLVLNILNWFILAGYSFASVMGAHLRSVRSLRLGICTCRYKRCGEKDYYLFHGWLFYLYSRPAG